MTFYSKICKVNLHEELYSIANQESVKASSFLLINLFIN